VKERIAEPQIEDPRGEEVRPESPSDSTADLATEALQDASHDLTPPDQRPVSWLRLAYAIEFLLALLVTLTLWSEVGGQSHLDMMPWYTKLACLMASAWCSVRFTAGLVEEKKVWNRRTRVWLSGLILVATVMAAITYYYHLHEETDEQDSEETAAAAMTAKSPLALFSE
jgi:hypothetical protein